MKPESQRGPEIEPTEPKDRFAAGMENVAALLRLKAVLDERHPPSWPAIDQAGVQAREKFGGTIRALALMVGGYERQFLSAHEMRELRAAGAIAGTPDLLLLTSTEFGNRQENEYLPVTAAVAEEIREMLRLPKDVRSVLSSSMAMHSLLQVWETYMLDQDAVRMGAITLIPWDGSLDAGADS